MFWDSSAIMPVVCTEDRSDDMTELLAADPEPAIWWATPVECLSALHRTHRAGTLFDRALADAQERLAAIMDDIDIVAPVDPVRQRAGRLLAVHAIRAADALQLAAALSWCTERPEGEGFVCLDDRLRKAASLEGFGVLPTSG
jgi:predicted nucleic acid-binding protein